MLFSEAMSVDARLQRFLNWSHLCKEMPVNDSGWVFMFNLRVSISAGYPTFESQPCMRCLDLLARSVVLFYRAEIILSASLGICWPIPTWFRPGREACEVSKPGRLLEEAIGFTFDGDRYSYYASSPMGLPGPLSSPFYKFGMRPGLLLMIRWTEGDVSNISSRR